MKFAVNQLPMKLHVKVEFSVFLTDNQCVRKMGSFIELAYQSLLFLLLVTIINPALSWFDPIATTCFGYLYCASHATMYFFNEMAFLVSRGIQKVTFEHHSNN